MTTDGHTDSAWLTPDERDRDDCWDCGTNQCDCAARLSASLAVADERIRERDDVIRELADALRMVAKVVVAKSGGNLADADAAIEWATGAHSPLARVAALYPDDAAQRNAGERNDTGGDVNHPESPDSSSPRSAAYGYPSDGMLTGKIAWLSGLDEATLDRLGGAGGDDDQ